MTSFLNTVLVEQLSIVVLAFDNVLTFRRVEIMISEPAKQYYRRRTPLLIIPVLIISLALVLDLTGHLEGGYGAAGVCKLVGTVSRTIFHTIPVLLTFIVATGLMLYTLFKLKQHTRQVGKPGTK